MFTSKSTMFYEFPSICRQWQRKNGVVYVRRLSFAIAFPLLLMIDDRRSPCSPTNPLASGVFFQLMTKTTMMMMMATTIRNTDACHCTESNEPSRTKRLKINCSPIRARTTCTSLSILCVFSIYFYR